MEAAGPALRPDRPDRLAAGGVAIGIDVGGTKIAGAVADLATGALAARREVPTRAARGGEPVLGDVLAMARDLLGAAERLGVRPVGLGLGVAELVDPAGRVFSGHRIAWDGVPVQERLGALLPARVEADVRAAALAEARFGAGRGLDHFLYVSIGTGVSAVSVQHGRPYAGSRGAALVIANGSMRHRCPLCGHEHVEVLEDLAGGPGLAGAMGVERAEQVVDAANAGDARAAAIIDHAAGALGQTLALLAGALDPEAVILGGGLGSAPGRYVDALSRALASGLWDGDARPLPVLRASLGPDAGVVGAALAAPPVERRPAARTGTDMGRQDPGRTQSKGEDQ
jgi:glucokinase